MKSKRVGIHKGKTVKKPWGHMQTHEGGREYWVKTITVKPGHRLSLQRHAHRSEVWVCIKGECIAEVRGKRKVMRRGVVVSFGPHTIHRISSKKGGTIAEIAFGSKVAENDIVRLSDDYGRK